MRVTVMLPKRLSAISAAEALLLDGLTAGYAMFDQSFRRHLTPNFHAVTKQPM
jgi:hypothetical protein